MSQQYPPPIPNNIGTPVMIRPSCAESPELRRGIVTGLSLWQAWPSGEATGDRLIRLPDGRELYYARWMFTAEEE